MNRFQLEIHEKYTKIVNNANFIGLLNRLAKIKECNQYPEFFQKMKN